MSAITLKLNVQKFLKRFILSLLGRIETLLFCRTFFSSLGSNVPSGLLLLMKIPLLAYFYSISFSRLTFSNILLKTSLVIKTIRHLVKALTVACLGLSLINAIYPNASPSL